MTVTLTDSTVVLSGDCPLEDAEILVQRLIENGGAGVDWTQCEHAHTAVIQVLMAAKRPLKGPPSGEFLKTQIDPALRGTGG